MCGILLLAIHLEHRKNAEGIKIIGESEVLDLCLRSLYCNNVASTPTNFE